MSNTQAHQPCPPWKKRLIYAGATIAATAGTLITWHNNTQEDQLDTPSSPNKAFLSLLYSAIAPCSWYVFCALELTEDECHCHKKPNNQADNQDQIGSINDPDIEDPQTQTTEASSSQNYFQKVAKSTLLEDPQTQATQIANSQNYIQKVAKSTLLEDPQTQATEISSSQNYFQKVAKSTLLIGHAGFLISAIIAPFILYQDLDNSLKQSPFNLDEKLGSANYIKTIFNHILIGSLGMMNFLVYNNFGYKDLKSLITNKPDDQSQVLPSKMLKQISFLLLLGGIAPGVMLSGSAISMQDLCVILFFGWPEIHLHRDHLPLVDKFLASINICRREPLINNDDLESQLNEAQDNAWLQDAADILGDSNEDKSPIASLAFCGKILCLLYGLAHASDDFYAFTSQSMHPNLAQSPIYQGTLLFFLGAGALFEVLIGALERSEQLATNDKPAIEPQIAQPARNTARRRNLRRAIPRANTALALDPRNPFASNGVDYAQLNPLSQGAQI